MQKTLDYIEENLKAEITTVELSDIAGFSVYHYYKLFMNTVGMPIRQYITRRKLLHCVYEINCGKPMIDVTLAYGFNTHSGFYKAFVREFNMSPSRFLKTHKANKPYRINLLNKDYIMLTKKQISGALQNWKLSNSQIKDIYYKNSGVRSENVFCVDDKYFIKFYTNLGQLKNHIKISSALKKVGSNAGLPIKAVDGEEIVKNGEAYCILTEKIAGSPMKSDELYSDPCFEKSKIVGEVIGQLSLVLSSIDDIALKEADLLNSLKNYGLPRSRNIYNLSDSFCKIFVSEFEDLYSKLPKQIIHRDPNLSNIMFSDNNYTFIDFDLCEKNLRIVDPCYVATSVLSEHIDKCFNSWLKIYKNIILGYHSVAKLSADEIKAIPYVILSNQLIFSAWFGEQDKLVECYETNKKMTRLVIDNFDKVKFAL